MQSHFLPPPSDRHAIPTAYKLLVKVVFFDAVPETAFIDKAVRVAVDGHGVGSVGLQLDRVRAGFLCSVDDSIARS